MKNLVGTLLACGAFTANGFTHRPLPFVRPSSGLAMEVRDNLFESFDLPEESMSGSNVDSDTRRFLSGDDLHKLRQQIYHLRQQLLQARAEKNNKLVRRISRSILSAQALDAEFVYQVSLERMEAAQSAGLRDEAATYEKEAKVARSCLPQFQLDGLWVGKYGNDFQMVNVSYVDDILVAHKITGDNSHVPKGEISFQVDLGSKSAIDPIELSPSAANQWGSRFLQRHTGLGQVAGTGYSNSQWLEGQLILVNENYFSFAWLPTGHQVFFGRPSPELILKMLRRDDSVQPEVLSQRNHLERCYEETEYLEDELEVSNDVFDSNTEYYYNQPGCFE